MLPPPSAAQTTRLELRKAIYMPQGHTFPVYSTTLTEGTNDAAQLLNGLKYAKTNKQTKKKIKKRQDSKPGTVFINLHLSKGTVAAEWWDEARCGPEAPGPGRPLSPHALQGTPAEGGREGGGQPPPAPHGPAALRSRFPGSAAPSSASRPGRPAPTHAYGQGPGPHSGQQLGRLLRATLGTRLRWARRPPQGGRPSPKVPPALLSRPHGGSRACPLPLPWERPAGLVWESSASRRLAELWRGRGRPPGGTRRPLPASPRPQARQPPAAAFGPGGKRRQDIPPACESGLDQNRATTESVTTKPAFSQVTLTGLW